jgi:predicted nuclease of restriction endonuclease-like RecB superfamily
VLSPELVRCRVKQGQLELTRWSAKTKERAQSLADEYLALAHAHVGSTRDELRQEWMLIPVAPTEKKLADGLLKLIEDAADFGSKIELPAAELRREVFLEASQRRRMALPDAPFEREQALAVVAERYRVSAAEVEEALYADLKGAERLNALGPLTTQQLLERYELGQVQAVLLRAVDVVAEVRCNSPLAYRHLFNKLKFRQLLYHIETTARGYRIRLDGPFSLFESVTKYGLQLALMLPGLLECDALELEARLRWGKQRSPVAFKYTHRGRSGETAPSVLADDTERLRVAVNEKAGAWQAAACTEILDLPGLGVCIPDLVFQNGKRRVYLEVLGYWSRDAVWRRVEMAERGFSAPVLFAVSSRLRVSEAVLEDSAHGALYVYKGSMSPSQVLKRVEALARR